MIHERDVRDKIAALLQNEISVIDFVRWIMANSWNMHRDSSDEAVDLVSRIHLLLAERDDDAYSASEFRAELGSLLNNISGSVMIVENPSHMPLIARHSASPAFWFQPEQPWLVQFA